LGTARNGNRTRQPPTPTSRCDSGGTREGLWGQHDRPERRGTHARRAFRKAHRNSFAGRNGMTFARIKALFSIQLAETKRDFGAVFLSLIFPLFFVLLLSGSVLLSPDFKVEFGIVNAGTNTEAREFADQLASQNVALRTLDAETAREGLDNGELSAVVIFPDGWTANGDAPLQLETGK